ncbi:MAG: M48 family metallopeptidase [Caulobacteraceae bacterium]|nr:M48 family metallopeptidase [Caulobacteraceae bacterium]
MEHFDPAAATQAYLNTMSAADMAKAIAYTRGGHWLILWGFLVSLVTAFIMVKSGIFSGLRQKIDPENRRGFLSGLVVGLVYMVVSWVLTLPWALYANWYREKSYGLNNQTWMAWLGENAMLSAIGAVVGAVVIALLYLLIRNQRRIWWLWGGALVGVVALAGMVLAPVYIEPLLNTYQPAPPGAVRDAVVELAHRTGTPDDKIYIYNGTKQSDRYTANVSGLFGSARVALSDAMFKKNADMSEIRAVVGHEMGHYVHNHGLIGAGILTLLAVVAFWLTDRLFPLFRGLLGANPASGIGDPGAMPVLFAVLAFVSLLATPATNTLTRQVEADADHFSMVHANEPDGMAKALIKTAEYRAPSPTPLEEIFFYDHPSVENRIRAAMEWKAAHMPAETPAAATSVSPATGAATRDHPAAPPPGGQPTGKE